MKIKELNPGDSVKLQTREREWTGIILQSYDSEIILLKLESGYNIGLREEDILNVKVIEKVHEKERKNIPGEIKKNLPNIALIITGGTISARLDPKTGGVIWTEGEDILNISPEIKKICNISKIDKPFKMASEDMSFKNWKVLAETCEKYLNDDSVSGIIITHGTDFIHYSSAALSFMLGKLNKPVALTYSQRSIDRGSTDAALNLLCAAKYAISDIAEVALLGHKDLNDSSCLAMPGTKVRKMHSSRRDAFKIINDSAIAEISSSEFKILKEFNARNKNKSNIDVSYNSNIAVIKIYPGQSPGLLDFYADQGYKGIILELPGLGHVPYEQAEFNWLPKIKKNIEKGIIICGCAQTIFGQLNPKVYSPGRDLEKTGIIFLKDMTSETAFVKLAWVLGHKTWGKDKEKIKEKMLENISGEFNEKLGFEF